MSDTHSRDGLIDKYMKQYTWKKLGCKEVSKEIEKTCRKSLRQEAIPCIVDSRAKEENSLKDKLIKKAKLGELHPAQEHVEDVIQDLAGVRIALFFPNHKSRVRDMIDHFFVIKDEKSFSGEEDMGNSDEEGYISRLPGYSALHFVVEFQKADSGSEQWRQEIKIEIQVQSVLQRAWADIQHDAVYKKIKPATSEERRIIDGLRGAIYLGEGFLDQLGDSQKLREEADKDPFDSVYDLATFVSKTIKTTANRKEESLGPIELLMQILKITESDSPKSLTEAIGDLGFANPDYEKAQEQYAPYQLKASIYIIDHILQFPKSSAIATGCLETARQQHREHIHKLKVLASTMMWLGELFRPFHEWDKKLAKDPDHQTPKMGLSWLNKHRTGRILRDEDQTEDKLDLTEQRTLDRLWDWFEGHEEKVIQFVFQVSKLGALKNFENEGYLLGNALSQMNLI